MDLEKIRRRWWGCIYDRYETETKDVQLLLALMGTHPQNVFEVCCGTGRVLAPLARAGHNAKGMDADEGMLARIPAKAQGLPGLRYRLADVLTSDWGRGHDVVVLADNTLMNLEHREDDKAAQQLVIHKAAEALRPGGHFFLAFDHYPNPEEVFISESKVTKGWYGGTDDAGVLGQVFWCGGLYNPVTRIAVWANHVELTLPDGQKHVLSGHGHKYVCAREDVHLWLKDAGFVIEKEFGGCDQRPFTCQADTDIIWAKKREDA